MPGGGESLAGAMSLSLLGQFELRQDNCRVRVPLSTQRVVAFLGLSRARVARIYVAGHLWMDSTEERAGAALRTALWRLGSAGRTLVRCDGQSLSLNPDVTVDVNDIVKVSRDVLAGDEVGLRRALDVLRDAGELLPDWYDDWVLIERERIRQLRLHALERLCVKLSADCRHSDAIEAGLMAVAADPLRESAHRALVEAHLAEGNVGEALRQYRICCQLLRRDLGIEPSQALTTMIANMAAAVTRA